jgi:hypothetical protein
MLAVLAENSLGELSISAQDYDGFDTAKLLTIDYNREKGLISIRVSKDNGWAVSVHPESRSWTKPSQDAPLERARTEATRVAQRRAIPSDEELADMEDEAHKRQILSKLEAEGKTPLRINVKP